MTEIKANTGVFPQGFIILLLFSLRKRGYHEEAKAEKPMEPLALSLMSKESSDKTSWRCEVKRCH